MAEILIIADLKLAPGQKADLWPALQDLVAGSRAEEGNISYNLVEDLKDPDHLVVVERWKSQSAIDEHNSTVHFQNFLNCAKDVKTTITLFKDAL